MLWLILQKLAKESFWFCCVPFWSQETLVVASIILTKDKPDFYFVIFAILFFRMFFSIILSEGLVRTTEDQKIKNKSLSLIVCISSTILYIFIGSMCPMFIAINAFAIKKRLSRMAIFVIAHSAHIALICIKYLDLLPAFLGPQLRRVLFFLL